MSGLRFLGAELAALESAGLLRVRPTAGRSGPPPIVLCSNDYLGLAALASDDAMRHATLGSGASPLIAGYGAEHSRAENALAAWLGSESATMFSSGYAANVGSLQALAGPGDLIVSDRLNHASIIDGARLSGAKVAVFAHRDVAAARQLLRDGREFRRRFLVTESYFSMDGDLADVAGLREVADEVGAVLYVDEAHALGVFGPEGRGVCAEAGVVPEVLVGTLGKAFGLMGSFVSGSAALGAWLWNRARSLVFSTALSPRLAAAIPGRLQLLTAGEALRARLSECADGLRSAAPHRVLAGSRGPIIPWVVGSEAAAVQAAQWLKGQGVFVAAIRPPTVPKGTARLRIAARANLAPEELSRVCEALRAAP